MEEPDWQDGDGSADRGPAGGFAVGGGEDEDQRKKRLKGDEEKVVDPPPALAQGDAGLLDKALHAPPTKRSDRDAPAVTRIDQPDLERVREIYVYPPDYRQRCASGAPLKDSRVWIVHGPQHTGKFTTALRLALDLEGERNTAAGAAPSIFNYRRFRNDPTSLIDFMRRDGLAAGTYLIEDAFERNVDLQDIASQALVTLDRVLQKQRCYLVLTTELRAKDLEDSSAGKISAELDDLGEVFTHHLDRFARHVETVDIQDQVLAQARGLWESLRPLLRRPVQIERFCHKLGELRRNEVSVDSLIKVAEEAAYIGQRSVREMFRDLNGNERLYAMLAVLFDGLERVDLERIYDLAVASLREAGVDALHEPLQDGLDELLERIRARERAHQVEFEDEDFRAEVVRQLRNYRRLLWKLSEVLLGLCVVSSAPQHWELRRSIGAALGRLGVHERRRLEPVRDILLRLARDGDGGVVAVAGYMLEQVCRDGLDLHEEVVELLEEWVTSRDPDLMWAAGASVWRVYGAVAGVHTVTDGHTGPRPALTERLLDVIATLADRAGQLDPEKVMQSTLQGAREWEPELWRCAFFALRRLATIHPPSLVAKLSDWLATDNGSVLRRLAQLVARNLFEEQTISVAAPIETREGEWLRLIQPILATAPDDAGSGDAMMAALASWLRWPGWEDRVLAALLSAANRSIGAAGEALRSGLARHWLAGEADNARRLGSCLICRSHAMDGLPARDRRGSRGILALDGSSGSAGWSLAATVALQIEGVLRCYSDLTVVHVGGGEIPVEAEHPVESRALLPSYPRPRLLVTPVTAARESRGGPSFVVVLACGRVIDWDDAVQESWAPRIVVAGTVQLAGNARGAPPRTVVLGDLDALLAAVVTVLEASPAHPELPSGPGEWQAASRQLDGWLELLDQPAGLEKRGDAGRLIVATFLDGSGVDFAAAMAALRRWLAPAAPQLARRSAAAATRALCRFYAERLPRLALGSRQSLLEVALLLGEPEWTAAESALDAALCWMDDDEWASRLGSGMPLGEGLMSWVEAWIARRQAPLRKLIRGWRSRSQGEGSTVAPAALRLLERMEFRVALGAGEALPQLQSDQLYGVVVLDASFRSRPLREALARLAGELLALAGRGKPLSAPLLLFRMGRRLPLAVPGEKPDEKGFLPPELGRLPRLVGPVLELMRPEQIRFVLLLTTGPILDGDDWVSGPWAQKTFLFGPRYGTAGSEPFTRIPSPTGEEEGAAIARYLSRKGA